MSALLALDWYLDSPREILLVYPEGKKADLAPFLQAMRDNFLPNAVVVTLQTGPASSRRSLFLLQHKPVIKDSVTAYLCEKVSSSDDGSSCVSGAVDQDPRLRCVSINPKQARPSYISYLTLFLHG